MNFESVVGQSALTTTLRNSITSGKLAHAYLFCGPRGVGKTTCARIFAKTINCLHPHEDGTACGVCESCQAFDEGRSLNISELDAASNNSVDDIRQLIEQVQIPPQIGRYKVFIIDEVHMLTTNAFNAFLKTLEEPPAHAIFVLATTEKHKILPTILSRCQTYDFNRMEVADIVAHLKNVADKEGYTYEESALGVIARKADGGMRDALSIFDQVASFAGGNITYQKVTEDLNVLDYDYYFRATDLLLASDVSATMLLLGEIIGKGFAPNHFMQGLAAHLRDLLVSRDEQTTQLLEVEQEVRERYKAQAQRCKPQWLYHALRLCNDCDQAYKTSNNKRLLVELTLIETAQLNDPDVPSSGLSPIKIHTLRPIFAALQQPTISAAQRHAPTTPAAPAAVATTPTPPTSSASAVRPQQPPRHRTASLSIRGLRQTLTQTQPASETQEPTSDEAPQQQPTAATTPQQPVAINEEQLQLYWTRYALSLPPEHAPLSGRMRAHKPSLAADGSITFMVENEMVQQFMQRAVPYIAQYLSDNLHIPAPTITLSIDKTQHDNSWRSMTPRQYFTHKIDSSKDFKTLVEALHLQLT